MLLLITDKRLAAKIKDTSLKINLFLGCLWCQIIGVLFILQTQNLKLLQLLYNLVFLSVAQFGFPGFVFFK